MDYWTENRSLRGAVSLVQINFNWQKNCVSQLTDLEHQFQIELFIEPQIDATAQAIHGTDAEIGSLTP